MRIAPLADVKARFSRYVEGCQREPVVVTKNGRPAAVLVAAPQDEMELERVVLANTPRFRELLNAAGRRLARGGALSHAEFWSRVSMPAARGRGRRGRASAGAVRRPQAALRQRET